LRDETHNRVSDALLPKLAAYRAKLPPGATRDDVDALSKEIRAVTSLDASVLAPQVKAITDQAVREALQRDLTASEAKDASDPVTPIASLARLMVTSRQTVAAKKVSPADRRRLVDVAITTSAVI